MNEFFELPIFGVFITLLAFYIAGTIKQRYKFILLNPVLVAISLIITFLVAFDLDFEDYNRGGQYLGFFLGPSVVALGVLFYEKYRQIQHNLVPFLAAVCIGGVFSIVNVVLICVFMNAPDMIIKSIAPKSITTPMAVEVSEIVGGVPSITAGVVIAVGIFGNAFGPAILRFLNITSQAAIGAALGTAAHGIGTARALEDGELTGAYSGLALCVNGVLTSIITPLAIRYLG